MYKLIISMFFAVAIAAGGAAFAADLAAKKQDKVLGTHKTDTEHSTTDTTTTDTDHDTDVDAEHKGQDPKKELIPEKKKH